MVYKLRLGELPGAIFWEVKMRLDKYLKVSRLIKRRTIANEACDGERVSVNGKVAKASYEVKTGDVIEMRFGQRTVKVEVITISEHTTKADAPAMYREI
jgi:Ribosome-associated heat shock protein implicated in the recycling of the 50S subunit (S4 paralog)